MRTVAFAPGAIDWGLGMDQAAAYVTQRDPAVETLARTAGRLVAMRPRDEFSNRNLGFAVAITDALAELGVTYVPDPATPFATVSGTSHAVDTINYPYETLTRRSGDCDDSSVLMASLLGNLGVETQFVDAPGHIFLLFDTGLHERNRSALGVDSSLTVVIDGEVWAPLETTAISKGFMEAWHIGAEEVAKWSAQGQIFYWPVTEAQERYEPATPPGVRKMAVPDTQALERRITAEAREYGALRDTFFASNYGTTGHDLEISAAALVEIAGVNFQGGDLEGARTQLESALQKSPQSVASHNDLGVVLASLGKLSEAEEHWRTAAVLDSRNAGVVLNLGVAQCFRGDSLAGREMLARGAGLAGGFRQACGLLGLSPADSLQRSSEGAAGPDAPDAWLRAQLRAALAAPVVRTGSARRRAASPSGRAGLAPMAGPAPDTLAVPAFPAVLRQHLWWIN